jgi:acyl-homoserine-lactone acylase
VAPAQPLSTPRRLDTANPEVLRALARAVVRIGRAKVALDAPLGSIQTTGRGTERIAVPGGESNDGVFNHMTISPLLKADTTRWARPAWSISWNSAPRYAAVAH